MSTGVLDQKAKIEESNFWIEKKNRYKTLIHANNKTKNALEKEKKS